MEQDGREGGKKEGRKEGTSDTKLPPEEQQHIFSHCNPKYIKCYIKI